MIDMTLADLTHETKDTACHTVRRTEKGYLVDGEKQFKTLVSVIMYLATI